MMLLRRPARGVFTAAALGCAYGLGLLRGGLQDAQNWEIPVVFIASGCLTALGSLLMYPGPPMARPPEDEAARSDDARGMDPKQDAPASSTAKATSPHLRIVR